MGYLRSVRSNKCSLSITYRRPVSLVSVKSTS